MPFHASLFVPLQCGRECKKTLIGWNHRAKRLLPSSLGRICCFHARVASSSDDAMFETPDCARKKQPFQREHGSAPSNRMLHLCVRRKSLWYLLILKNNNTGRNGDKAPSRKQGCSRNRLVCSLCHSYGGVYFCQSVAMNGVLGPRRRRLLDRFNVRLKTM